jgi:5-bromo-4-chloroindolyl phosphate hydrolysis protein
MQMKPKNYMAHQAAELTGREYHALRKQLDRDSKKIPGNISTQRNANAV